MSEVSEVMKFLESINLFNYNELLHLNGFDDINTIYLLTENDLIDIGIDKKGHRLKLLNEIKKRKQTDCQSNLESTLL